MRFDPKLQPSKEWRAFGSFYFFIPQVRKRSNKFLSCSLESRIEIVLFEGVKEWDS